MPVKTSFVTEQHIKSISLPQHGKTYTVIPHGYAIDQTKIALDEAGFEIKNELYKSTLDGQVVQGIYNLNYGDDSDMGLMFAWSNSYDKSKRFKCAIGGHVFVCMNGIVRGNIGTYVRKHTGSALFEAEEHIVNQIKNAKSHFDLLIEDKEILKQIILSPKEKGAILGRLFAEYDILTLTQVGIVKREIDKPSFNYNCDADSAWAMYNHITFALKESHPQTYLQDHEALHDFFINEYGQLKSNKKSLEQLSLNFSEEPEAEEVLYETETALVNGVVFL